MPILGPWLHYISIYSITLTLLILPFSNVPNTLRLIVAILAPPTTIIIPASMRYVLPNDTSLVLNYYLAYNISLMSLGIILYPGEFVATPLPTMLFIITVTMVVFLVAEQVFYHALTSGSNTNIGTYLILHKHLWNLVDGFCKFLKDVFSALKDVCRAFEHIFGVVEKCLDWRHQDVDRVDESAPLEADLPPSYSHIDLIFSDDDIDDSGHKREVATDFTTY